MKDVYLNPTVRRLAAALAEEESASGLAREAASASPDSAAAPAGRSRYVLCGALQLLVFLGSVCAGSLVLDAGATWTAAGHGVPGIYARTVMFGAAVLLGMNAAPIAAKWILIGCRKPQRITVWSMAYLRFWIVKTGTPPRPGACVPPVQSITGTALPAAQVRTRRANRPARRIR
jgi:hypothetical protein